MTSRTASTALPASLLPRSDRLATWSTNSDFVTLGLLLGEVVVERRYQRSRTDTSPRFRLPTAILRLPDRRNAVRAPNVALARLRSVAGAPDAMSSRRPEGAGGDGEIEAGDTDQRPRPERRGDRVPGAADHEHVAAVDVVGVRPLREGGRRASPHVGVAGEHRAARVEDRGAAEVDRQRRHPREGAGGREPGVRHRDAPGANAVRSRARPAGPQPRRDDRRAATGPRRAAVGRARDNARVTFIRIAWLVTVLACIVTGVVLLVSGYQGYAAVFGAVGACAAINLR